MNADGHRPGPRQLSVLALDTDWFSAHGGITTVNRHLCIALAAQGARVFCAVPEAGAEELSAAASVGVELVTVPRTPGVEGHDRLLRRPNLPDDVQPDLIIGHGRITGPAASALAEDHYPAAARLHVIHTTPDETEWARLDEIPTAGERAQPRHETEIALAATATRTAAIGPRLYQEAVRNLSTYYGVPAPLRLDPGFDEPPSPPRTPPPGGPQQILVLGRLEDAGIKGLEIAAAAVGHAIAQGHVGVDDVEVLLRGAQSGTLGQLRGDFRAAAAQPALRVTPRTYTTSTDELGHDMRRASVMLMPSRAEAFGLVGAEAIMAGTPVLVSGLSGLGMLLTEVLGQDEARDLVVSVADNAEVDARQWGEALARVLADREGAFARADRIRHLLAARVTWAKAAADILSVCGTPAGQPEDNDRHWIDSVQVALPNGTAARLFSGRAKVLQDIAAWLDAADSAAAAIVTGDPGSGKSAVLAWFALYSDPDARSWLHIDSDVSISANVRWVPVHALGRDVAEIVAAIAVQAGVAAADPKTLIKQLAALPGRTCIVLDALDEAKDVEALIGGVIQPLCRDSGGVRLLIGARRHIARRMEHMVRMFDLDDEDTYADSAAIEHYAHGLLAQRFAGARAFQTSAERIHRVAKAVARAAGRSFLVARLAAVAIVARGELPSRQYRFPHEVGEAMSDYLDAVTNDRARAETLLRPLAFAHGRGLPARLWARLSGALAGIPDAYETQDVALLFGTPLASLLSVSRHVSHDGGPAVGRASYRLFHDALAEHLASATPAFPDAPQNPAEVRETITATLLHSVPAPDGARDWSRADDYVLDFVLEHALQTTALPDLVHDPQLLALAGARAVRRVLSRLPDSLQTAARAYESVSQHQTDATPPATRAAYLALAALRTADPELLAFWCRPGSNSATADWWPRTAWWRSPTSRRVLREHQGTINQVRLATTVDETVAISGSDDETVGLTSTGAPSATGIDMTPVDVTVRLSSPVRAIAVVYVDAMPLIVAGTADGRLTLIDLPGGGLIHAPTPRRKAAVTALAAVPDPQTPQVVAGHEDGAVRTWRVLPTELLVDETVGNTEILAIAPCAPGAYFVATGAGALWYRDPTGTRMVHGDEPVVSALAQATGLRLAADAVTGHTDGSVRLWSAGSAVPLRTLLLPDADTVTAVVAARIGDLDLVLAAGEVSEDIRVLEADGGTPLPATLTGHNDTLWGLAVDYIDGQPMVLGAGGDDRVHLWSLGTLDTTGPDTPSMRKRWQPARLGAAENRLLVVTVDEARNVAVLDALDGDVVHGPHGGPGMDICATAITISGSQVCYAAATFEELIGVATGDAPPTWVQTGVPGWIAELAYTSIAGTLMLVGVTTEGILLLLDPAGAAPIQCRVLPEPFQPVTAMAVVDQSPDGPLLLLGSRDGDVGAWRLPDLVPALPVRRLTDEALTSVTMSGDRVIAGTLSGSVHIVSSVGQQTMAAHQHSVERLVQIGKRLISGGQDGRVIVWDTSNMTTVSIDVGAPVADLIALPDDSIAVSTTHGTVTLEIR